MNIGFHPGRAGLLHLVGYMAVNVQGKRGCSMAKVSLDRFYIIPRTEGRNGITVTKIMKTGIRTANGRNNFFEVPDNSLWNQMATQLVGKHQIHGVIPGSTCLLLMLVLLKLSIPQKLHNPWDGRYFAWLIIFERNQQKRTARFLFLLQLPADPNGASHKIYAIPRQPQGPPPAGR